MKRTVAFLLGSVGLAASLQAAEPLPKCLGVYSEDLASIESQARRKVLRAVNGYDREARDGLELFLQYRDSVAEDSMERLVEALEHLRYRRDVPNPFPSDRELMAAIAEVERVNAEMVNYHRVLGDLGQEVSDGLAQAAAFDVYVARDIGRSGGGVAGFQVPESGPGGVRRVYDIKEVSGTCHETKSIVAPYVASPEELANPPVGPDPSFFEYADPRVNQLANETARSIVIHAADGYTLFRTDFTTRLGAVSGQADLIREVMLKQFESKLVDDLLGAQASAARAVFVANYDQIMRFR